ncbi:MAG: alanine--tRNA ligase [Candidatus Omnitrophica bacterium]|nr:alanine--tRNA ligase [Candidatus Omnitrophota bacterium]
MNCDEIRSRFLRFFEARGHKIVPSDSLVPANDPSVLFTGAGMNQFKEQFLGRDVTYRRAASSQKCLRTADLENVGRTAYHHTFFEMLGNFSFGDYFKKDAIVWAWEFLTSDLKCPADKLSVSVFTEDDEAYKVWSSDIKLPASKIRRLDDKENFWPPEARKLGPNGPCGPCSEIFYTRDAKSESIEVWNLVFTQFDRRPSGALLNLPGKNIDTGMGLERLASVMQGVRTNFEIDIFVPIVQAIKKELGPGPSASDPASNINAIADHIRAVTFAIADGVYPSNEERGFVIRKLIRKSIERAFKVDPDCGLFLYNIVPSVVKTMKAAYPELEARREMISQIVKAEEERFRNIILEIAPLLKEEFAAIKKGGSKKVPGEIIFRYSDEKGVPFDFQQEIAQELGLNLDIEGFKSFLESQKKRSRAKSKISKEIFAAPAGLARKEEEWDEASKLKIRINHTATHLLHSALRKVLGEHVWQSGSLVYPERLRFDFSHPKKLDKAEIIKVEELVNKAILEKFEVKREVMKVEEAKRRGAIALFGEKYGEEAIVRTIGDFSKELCGGDHINNTGAIRVFKIIQESSIAAGTRRIEAVTGDEVYEWLAGQIDTYRKKITIPEIDNWFGQKSAKTLVYDDIREWHELEDKISGLIAAKETEEKNKERELARKRKAEGGRLADDLVKKAKNINGVNVIAAAANDLDAASLRKLADSLLSKMPDSVILLASGFGGKAAIVLAVNKTLADKGLDARELIKPIAAGVGGSGGGRPDLAQAGGKDTAGIQEALGLIYNLIQERIK